MATTYIETLNHFSFSQSGSNNNSDGYSTSYFRSWGFNRNRKRMKVTRPDYRKVIASRGDASNPYSTWRQGCRSDVASAAAHYGYAGGAKSGTVLFFGNAPMIGVGDFLGPPGVVVPQDKYNLLLVNILKRIKSVRTSFDGSTNLGEFRETLHGLRNPASALRSGLSEYLEAVKKRSSKLKTLKRIVDVARQTYLEYAFGWRPLIGAIGDAGAALNDQLDTFTDVRSVATSLKWDEILHEADRVSSDDTLFWWDRKKVYQSEVSARIYAIVSRNCNQSNRFQRGLGLTPKDWLPAAWELLPFSFVVDYFVNIGSCLSAAGVVTDDVITIGLSYKNSGLITFECMPDIPTVQRIFDDGLGGAGIGYTGTTISMVPASSYFRHNWFDRRVLDKNDLGLIIPTMNIPSLPTQWINLAALSQEMISISKQVFRR